MLTSCSPLSRVEVLLHPNTPATALNLFFSHSYRYLNHASQSLAPHHPHDLTSHTHPCAEDLATSSLDGNECCRCLIPPYNSGLWDSTGAITLPGFQHPQEFNLKTRPQLSSYATRDPHSTVFPCTHHSQGHCHQNHHVPWWDTSPTALPCVHLPGHHPLYPRYHCALSPGCTSGVIVTCCGSECTKSWGGGVIVAWLQPQ